uniref:Replication-associated protein n=1 Tax=Wheat dwarf virus TaxID=10834 RepID=A0A0F6N401_9GEMI|nr:replication-associated protein [Wheat dwarf virus]
MASSSTPRFRVYSKYLFLTYPQCTLEPQYALDSLRKRPNACEPLYIAAVRELHEDGSPHLHVLVQNKLRASITNPNALNLRMDTSPFSIFHPNIQAAKDCNQVRDYITKEVDSDVNTAEWGTFVAVSTPGRKDRDADMKQIIESSSSREEFLSMVCNRFPFEWSIRLKDFEYTARHLFPDPVATYTPEFPTESLICHETIESWKNEHLYSESPGRHKSIYICGPTRTGKTSWARSLGTHNYYNSLVDFTTYDVNAKYNIIDDIPFKFTPNWKCFVGAQRDFTVNPKYGKRKVIRGGIPCIILVNPDEDWLKDMTPEQSDYMYSNAVVHYMYEGETFINYSFASGEDVTASQ